MAADLGRIERDGHYRRSNRGKCRFHQRLCCSKASTANGQRYCSSLARKIKSAAASTTLSSSCKDESSEHWIHNSKQTRTTTCTSAIEKTGRRPSTITSQIILPNKDAFSGKSCSAFVPSSTTVCRRWKVRSPSWSRHASLRQATSLVEPHQSWASATSSTSQS